MIDMCPQGIHSIVPYVTHVNVIIMNKIHVLVMWGIFSSFAHTCTYFPSCTLKKISLCVVLIESLVMVGNKKRKIFDCQMFLRFVNVSISNLMSRCCKPLKKNKKKTKLCTVWKVWCWECIHFRIWFN